MHDNTHIYSHCIYYKVRRKRVDIIRTDYLFVNAATVIICGAAGRAMVFTVIAGWWRLEHARAHCGRDNGQVFV